MKIAIDGLKIVEFFQTMMVVVVVGDEDGLRCHWHWIIDHHQEPTSAVLVLADEPKDHFASTAYS